jgi:hypothetical protein
MIFDGLGAPRALFAYRFYARVYSQRLLSPHHLFVDTKTQRQTGRQAQLSNIAAAKAVADIIRTTLGPRSMLKVSLCGVWGSVRSVTLDDCSLLKLIHSHYFFLIMISDATRSHGWCCIDK